MPGILKTKVSTYEFDLESMKELIAKDLEVDPRRVNVEYVIGVSNTDPRDMYPGVSKVTKICVTVSH